jgi:hypothetical protein
MFDLQALNIEGTLVHKLRSVKEGLPECCQVLGSPATNNG